jgi:hypothetical protein
MNLILVLPRPKDFMEHPGYTKWMSELKACRCFLVPDNCDHSDYLTVKNQYGYWEFSLKHTWYKILERV